MQEKQSRSKVSRSCKKIKKNKGQDINQIPGRRVASELLDHNPTEHFFILLYIALH